MNQTHWSEAKVAGAVLAASLLVLVLAGAIMILSGATAGFGPMIRKAWAGAAPYASTFRLLILLFVVGWAVQLIGLSLLGRLLGEAGQGQLAAFAFTLALISGILTILFYTFRMSVDPGVARQMAAGGEVPASVDWIRQWLEDTASLAYPAYFMAIIGFGAAIQRCRVGAPWVGPTTIGWSALWLVASFVGFGIPALPLIMPAVIGFALLRT